MKNTITYLFLLCSLFAQAQNVEYSIYAPSKDSFFLVETVTGVASKDAPKPGKSETSQLFRSEAQLLDYIQYLRNQSVTAIEKAEKVVKDADENAIKAKKEAETKSAQLREAAPRIKSAADKIEAVAVKNRDVLRGKKSEATKPKKKKKV